MFSECRKRFSRGFRRSETSIHGSSRKMFVDRQSLADNSAEKPLSTLIHTDLGLGMGLGWGTTDGHGFSRSSSDASPPLSVSFRSTFNVQSWTFDVRRSVFGRGIGKGLPIYGVARQSLSRTAAGRVSDSFLEIWTFLVGDWIFFSNIQHPTRNIQCPREVRFRPCLKSHSVSPEGFSPCSGFPTTLSPPLLPQPIRRSSFELRRDQVGAPVPLRPFLLK